MVAPRRYFGLSLLSSDPPTVVTGVQVTGPNTAKWTFSTAVTSDSLAVPALRDNTLGGAAAPTATSQNGANAVNVTYGASPNPGDTWQMLPPVTHLTSAFGFGPTQSGVMT